PADIVLNLVDFESFMAGQFYITATDGTPDEVVRGQLVPEGIDLHMIELSGADQVPEVTTVTTGIAAVTLDVASRTTQIHVNVENAPSAVTGISIHQQFAGHNGPGIISLTDDMMEDPGDPDHWFLNDLTWSAAQDQAYSAGQLYFNVLTGDYPTGELRGQIVPPAIDVFFTDMTGLQVVGDGITPQAVATNANAEAATTGDPATKMVTIYLSTNDLDDATTVAINQAPAGQQGPEIFTLAAEPNDDDPNDGITRRWFVLNHQLTDAQWAAYESQGLYARVATPGHPIAEVRGQLVPPGSSAATDPAAFQVLETSFTPGEIFTAFPEVVWATFTKPVLAESLSATNVIVEGAGGDMSFGEGNEVVIQPNTRDVSSADPDTVILGFLGANAGEDTYRLRIIGDSSETAPLTDAEGLIFDGDADGNLGGNFQRLFAVSDALQVSSTSFTTDETFTSFPTNVSVTFTKAVDSNTLNAGNVFVQSSGGDGTFGNGNETSLTALSQQVSPDGMTVTLAYDTGFITADTYQLVVVGDGGGALKGLDGNAFDGDQDLMPGGNWTDTFIFAPQAATFTRIQTEIFNQDCTSSSCHDSVNPSAGLNLEAGVAYANLVNQPAAGGGTLVIPGDADNSVLVGRVEGTIGIQMPVGGMLSASLQQLIRDWVDNGAMNN
ncbi:MAG: CHRD domain-containing protein, partial [Gammaproteobacteria bacterium]